MTKLVLVSAIGIAGAVLLGYVGGAMMATEPGRALLATVAALLVLIGVVEGAHTIARSSRA